VRPVLACHRCTVYKVAERTISHYTILEKLGQGGMGTVYKAEDQRLKRTVALKFLTQAAFGDDEARQRFVREAQTAAVLDHPNICATYGIEDEQGAAFIVMAYVEGEDLDARMSRQPLKTDEVIRIASDVAQGLQEAHQKGVVHRDIKPGNIKLTAKGAKVMDFGLAKLADSPHLTRTGMIVGTAAYMSPEQTFGKGVDHRTDIWSLGVMMYQMLARRVPFTGAYEQEIRYGVINEAPESLCGLRPEISPSLEAIVFKAIAKDPDERYQSATEVLRDLSEEQRKTEAVPASHPTGQQRSMYVIVGVLSVLLLVALAVIGWLAVD
jgi:eukaryotic-like serine/threonine-protein kinase